MKLFTKTANGIKHDDFFQFDAVVLMYVKMYIEFITKYWQGRPGSTIIGEKNDCWQAY